MWLTCTLANMSSFAEHSCDTIREAVGYAHNNPCFRAWVDVAGLPVYVQWHTIGKNLFIQLGIIASSTHELLEAMQNLKELPSRFPIMIQDVKGVITHGASGFDIRQMAGWTVEMMGDQAVFVREANYP